MWPPFCAFMCGSAAAMPYSTPLMLTSIMRSQSSILRRSSGELGIRPALLTMTSMRPNLSTAASTRRCTSLARARELGGQRLDAIDAARAEHHDRALRRQHARGRLAESAAGAGDDHDLAF